MPNASQFMSRDPKFSHENGKIVYGSQYCIILKLNDKIAFNKNDY